MHEKKRDDGIVCQQETNFDISEKLLSWTGLNLSLRVFVSFIVITSVIIILIV